MIGRGAQELEQRGLHDEVLLAREHEGHARLAAALRLFEELGELAAAQLERGLRAREDDAVSQREDRNRVLVIVHRLPLFRARR